MALFGQLGYRATTVAMIERAAGLSAGSGGLYKHFPSKQAVLEAGVRPRIERADALSALGDGGAPPDPRAALRAIAAAGLDRLDTERDLNRILVRDLEHFPDLLELFRRAELERLHAGLGRALAALGSGTDPDALALVLISAVSHYWLIADVFGGVHPVAVDRDAYLDALADVALAAIAAPPIRKDTP